jgi:hypothetical protein
MTSNFKPLDFFNPDVQAHVSREKGEQMIA